MRPQLLYLGKDGFEKTSAFHRITVVKSWGSYPPKSGPFLPAPAGQLCFHLSGILSFRVRLLLIKKKVS